MRYNQKNIEEKYSNQLNEITKIQLSNPIMDFFNYYRIPNKEVNIILENIFKDIRKNKFNIGNIFIDGECNLSYNTNRKEKLVYLEIIKKNRKTYTCILGFKKTDSWGNIIDNVVIQKEKKLTEIQINQYVNVVFDFYKFLNYNKLNIKKPLIEHCELPELEDETHPYWFDNSNRLNLLNGLVKITH